MEELNNQLRELKKLIASQKETMHVIKTLERDKKDLEKRVELLENVINDLERIPWRKVTKTTH